MRIAVDGHMIGLRESGNESYVVNLLRAYAVDPGGHQYQVLTPRPQQLNGVPRSANLQPVKTWPALSGLRIPFSIPAAAWANKTDVLHATYVLPPVAPCPMVVTVHDLSFIPYPKALSFRARLVLRTLVPVSVRVAARVIAISEFTKRDLIKAYRIAPEKIRVTHLAPAASFRPLEENGDARLPGGITEPFILAVGNLEPRKNLGRLIDAFGSMVRDRNFSGNMVLAGKLSRAAREVSRLLRQLGLEKRVVLAGYVSEAELRILYARAAVFVYPSLYEGFGLPPLEAMACSCPVVASNAAALPEILGDAAILVDPLSANDLTEAIHSVVTRPELARELRAKGLVHAGSFSWRKTAAQTRAVYEELAPISRSGGGGD